MIIEWRPDKLISTPVTGGSELAAGADEKPASLSLLTWNIGYAGLGAEADFFMDGGEQVRPASRELVFRNLDAARRYLASNPADVILLQEVDRDASRSYGIDQVSGIAAALPGHFCSRAPNFKVPWIPYPLLEPIGKVDSGLLSMSRFMPGKAIRHQLPGNYSWPVRVFHLKRCLHEIRFPAPDGKDWVVINLHLSVFDKGGRLRKQQMKYLRQLITGLVAEGHHVIAGGDWNQAFPGIEEDAFAHTDATPGWFRKMEPGWLPQGFSWAFDADTPSLRATNKPLATGENFLTVVDGFAVGPGVDVLSVRATDLGFAHTDHHPVHIEISLAEQER